MGRIYDGPHTLAFLKITLPRMREAWWAGNPVLCRMTGVELETVAAVGVAVVAEAVSASVTSGSAPEDWTLGHCSL